MYLACRKKCELPLPAVPLTSYNVSDVKDAFPLRLTSREKISMLMS